MKFVILTGMSGAGKYSDVNSCLNEQVMFAINGEKTAEEAMNEAAKNANQFIKDAQ